MCVDDMFVKLFQMLFTKISAAHVSKSKRLYHKHVCWYGRAEVTVWTNHPTKPL